MRNYLYIILGAMLLTLSACASTPEPEPTPPPTQTQPVTPPTTVAPPTSETIVENVIIDETPMYSTAIPGSEQDFIYQSGGDSRVYFALNQYNISNNAADTLRRQAAWLQLYPEVTAVIEGNADERGTREYNLALGARRAESVKDFLVAQGVAGYRLTTVSYGKERPIDPRSDEAGWARNRNANTHLISGTIG